MRKFSKKIAMMMVLAMLVSLFSGIVSASAASMWSAKSVDDDNYAVVMGETIEVKKGEFINFDLFKNDVEATEAGYTYTWESSDAEVLFINGAQGAKNGYARVKGEVGEKATISVSFTNLATGVTVKTPRTFNVVVVEELKADEAEVAYDIVAKFGEETFVVGNEYDLAAVVTADGEEVAAQIEYAIDGKAIEGKYAPAAAGDVTIVITAIVGTEKITKEVKCVVEEATVATIVAAVQKDAKTVELTFDSAITEDEAKTIELYLGTVVKNSYKKAVKVKDNVVTFESYATFGNGKTWTFVYGDSKFDLKSSQGEVAEVIITGPEFFYLKSNGADNGPAEITFVCKDALGVKVGMPTTGDAYIEWKLDSDVASVTSTVNDAGDDVPAILFTEKDKVVVLSGIYHTGKLDEANNWEEITFPIGEYVITSVDNNDATMVGIGSKGVADEKTDADSNDAYKSLTVPANTDNFKLFVKFVYDDAKASQKTAAELGNDDKGNPIVTYESTDSSKLIVDPKTGLLIPLKQGVVDVIVNVKGEFYGVVPVTVGPAVASTAPTVKASASQISNSTLLGQTIEFKAEGKDNYQVDLKDTRAFKITKAEVKSDPYNPTKADEKAIKDALVGSFIICTGDDNKVTVNGAGLKAGNYVLKLTIKGFDQKEYTQNVSFVVRAAKADDEVKSLAIEFVNGKNAFDTAATKDTADLAGKVEFKIVGKNAAGVAVKYMPIASVSHTLEIKLGSDKVTGVVFGEDSAYLNLYKEDATNGVYTTDGATVYAPIKNGTYVITGKLNGQTVPTATFTVSNSQATPAIEVKEAAIAITSGDDVDEALEACFAAPKNADNGDYTFSKVTKGDFKYTDGLAAGTVGEYSVFVKSVKVTQTFMGNVSVNYTVDVNQSITVTVNAAE